MPSRGTQAWSLAAVAASAILWVVGAPLSAQQLEERDAAVDPFYEELFRQGSFAFDRGDYAAAIGDLRVASFGLLERPTLLAEALVRLALAYAETGDRESLAKATARLAEIEERFHSYTDSSLPAELRARFVARVLSSLDPSLFQRYPKFGELASHQGTAAATVAPELEPGLRTIAAYLEAGRVASSLLEIDSLLGSYPAESRLHCLRGRALSRLDSCGEALAAFERCPVSKAHKVAARARLTCLLQLERTAEAEKLLARLAQLANAD